MEKCLKTITYTKFQNFKELAEDLHGSQSKTVKLSSDQNTSKLMWLDGFKYDLCKTHSIMTQSTLKSEKNAIKGNRTMYLFATTKTKKTLYAHLRRRYVHKFCQKTIINLESTRKYGNQSCWHFFPYFYCTVQCLVVGVLQLDTLIAENIRVCKMAQRVEKVGHGFIITQYILLRYFSFFFSPKQQYQYIYQ